MRRALFLIALLLICGCHRAVVPTPASPSPTPLTTPPAQAEQKKGSGLVFTMSEGAPQDTHEAAANQAYLKPLSAEQTQALLARLPAFTAMPEVEDFAVRPKSLPRPRTGGTVVSAFPAPTSAPKPETDQNKPLQVVRHAPEGEVPRATQLSVTFNQSMVALTSHADLAEQEPPVKLTPAPKGKWRWVGTRTVLFEPEGGHFPMATEYKVEVPKGAQSASGQPLAAPLSWTFRTPAVSLVDSFPNGGPHDLDPLMWARFDQDINAETVLKKMRLKGRGKLGLRAATPEELKAADRHPNPRLLAFKATRKLEPATTYTVEIGAGTASKEGPLKTKKGQSFSFSTYGKLEVKEHGCGYYYGEPCPPLTPFFIEFNNTIDTKKLDPNMVKVTPRIPEMKVVPLGTRLSIEGKTRGQITYKVSLDPALSDVFGQQLGKSKPLEFKVGKATRNLIAPGRDLVHLDPNSPTRYGCML